MYTLLFYLSAIVDKSDHYLGTNFVIILVVLSWFIDDPDLARRQVCHSLEELVDVSSPWGVKRHRAFNMLFNLSY